MSISKISKISKISVKTLSGDVITLEASNKEEFIIKYKEKYIDEKDHPFVTIAFLDDEKEEKQKEIENILINVHDLPYFLDMKKIESRNAQKNLSLNQHPKALEYVKDPRNSFSIFSNKNAIHMIKELLKDRVEVTDDLSLIHLARNTSDEALDILDTFDKNYFMEEVWDELCINPNPKAFKMVLKYMNYIELKEDKDVISLFYLNLCENPNAVEYLEHNPDLIHWTYFSENPMAIDLLLKNKEKIYYKGFCRNPHPEAIKIIKRIIKQEGFKSKKIDLFKLFGNTSKEMVQFIKENLDKIDKKDIDYQKNTIYTNHSALSLIEELYKRGYEITSWIWLNEGIFRNEDISNL
jgi:hypothetical protein